MARSSQVHIRFFDRAISALTRSYYRTHSQSAVRGPLTGPPGAPPLPANGTPPSNTEDGVGDRSLEG